MDNILARIGFWFQSARAIALPQSLLPAITAVCLACQEDSFNLLFALIALTGVAMAHLAFNLLDDYFDYLKKGHLIRERIAAGGMRARLRKCEYLTSGAATVKQLLGCIAVFLAIAIICGVAVFIYQGWKVLLFPAIAGVFGFFYSAPPFKFSYRGIGELVIILLFGPLLMSGVYYAATGIMSPQLWYLSIAIGMLVGNISYSHDIMDMEADRKSGKLTLCLVLKTRIAIFIVSAVFIFSAYLLILAGVVWGGLSLWYLSVFVTLPHAIKLYSLLLQFEKEEKKQFKAQWWMQPMERWKGITEAGIDWFMIRWFLARNLLIYFCIIIILINLF